MMKRGVWLLVVAWVALAGVAQRADYHKMSRYVRQATVDYQKGVVDQRQYHVTRGFFDNGQTLTAFVCIRNEEADAVLERHFSKKLAQWGDICIASIPLGELEALAKESAVRRIEANQSMDFLKSVIELYNK